MFDEQHFIGATSPLRNILFRRGGKSEAREARAGRPGHNTLSPANLTQPLKCKHPHTCVANVQHQTDRGTPVSRYVE